MSKADILAAIRANKPADRPLPESPSFTTGESDLPGRFAERVETGGGKVVATTAGQNLPELVSRLFPGAQRVASTIEAMPGTVDLRRADAATELERIDVAVIPARIGVAENGAVWVSEAECGPRVLPFITQHLIVVLSPGQIVETMHEAYRRIRIDETGFGVFIAGPSKTADIEQSLVIGAQGARSFTVLKMDGVV